MKYYFKSPYKIKNYNPFISLTIQALFIVGLFQGGWITDAILIAFWILLCVCLAIFLTAPEISKYMSTDEQKRFTNWTIIPLIIAFAIVGVMVYLGLHITATVYFLFLVYLRIFNYKTFGLRSISLF